MKNTTSKNTTITLNLNKVFSTKNDAYKFITGKNMANNMIVGENNICFIQRGEAYYKNRDNEKVITGINRIYNDRIESLVPEKLKPAMRNTSSNILMFEKFYRRNNKALTFYRFLGVFKVKSLDSVASGDLNYGVYTKVADNYAIKR